MNSRIALAAILAGAMIMMTGGCGPSASLRNGAFRNRTMSFHLAAMSALENYYSQNGEYPAPAQPSVKAVINGREYEVSAALMLYQVLSGDGNDRIKTGLKPHPSNGQVEPEELDEVHMREMPLEMILKTDLGWMLVDGFGHPFQYSPRGPDSINRTYDLWSYGGHEPPASADLNTKKTMAEKDGWIANW